MRRVIPLVLAALAVFALWYLRDPAWLVDQTTGLRAPQREPDGAVTRWSGGHASFFVPSHLASLRIPLSTTFDPLEAGGDRPMMVTFTIDDEKAGRILLTGPEWQEITLPMPAPGTRRVRRIDLRTNVTREGNRGVRIGQYRP